MRHASTRSFAPNGKLRTSLLTAVLSLLRALTIYLRHEVAVVVVPAENSHNLSAMDPF